jgi:hypothetical protein
MTNAEDDGSSRASREVSRAWRRERTPGLLATIRLSYFAWLPTVAAIGLGIAFLVTGEPVWFVLSSVVGLCAALGWAVWFNVDR